MMQGYTVIGYRADASVPVVVGVVEGRVQVAGGARHLDLWAHFVEADSLEAAEVEGRRMAEVTEGGEE